MWMSLLNNSDLLFELKKLLAFLVEFLMNNHSCDNFMIFQKAIYIFFLIIIKNLENYV